MNFTLKKYLILIQLFLFPTISIAGLARMEYNTRDVSEMMDRTKALFSIARSLKWLADSFEVRVIVVNQVGNLHVE